MKTVLIADDDSTIRKVVRATLEDGEMEILEAADGEDALRLVRERHPDLVLLDVMMPKLSGFEVCDEIKADPSTSDVSVIILTVLAGARDRERGANADAYFAKPFSPVALLEKIDDLLGAERVEHTRS